MQDSFSHIRILINVFYFPCDKDILTHMNTIKWLCNCSFCYIHPSFPSFGYLTEENLQLIETLLIKLNGALFLVCRNSLCCNLIDFCIQHQSCWIRDSAMKPSHMNACVPLKAARDECFAQGHVSRDCSRDWTCDCV